MYRRIGFERATDELKRGNKVFIQFDDGSLADASEIEGTLSFFLNSKLYMYLDIQDCPYCGSEMLFSFDSFHDEVVLSCSSCDSGVRASTEEVLLDKWDSLMGEEKWVML